MGTTEKLKPGDRMYREIMELWDELRWNGKFAKQAGEQEANFRSHIFNSIPDNFNSKLLVCISLWTVSQTYTISSSFAQCLTLKRLRERQFQLY